MIDSIMRPYPQQKEWIEDRFFQALGWAVLFAHMSVQILACLMSPVAEYDDAIPLVSAELVRLGRTPAIDFTSFYPPGLYYAFAAGFQLFGRSVLVVRFFAAGLYVAAVVAIGLFLRQALPHLRSLLPLLILPSVIACGMFHYPSWPGYALALLSVLTYIGARSGRFQARWTAVAGLLAGLSSLIRFNFGPYAAVVVGADLLIATLNAGSLKATLKRALLQAAAFGVPFILLNLIFYSAVYETKGLTAPWGMVRYSMHVMSSRLAFLPLGTAPHTSLLLVCPCVWIFVRKAMQVDNVVDFQHDAVSVRLPTAALVPVAASAVLAVSARLSANEPSVSLWFPALSALLVIALHSFVVDLPRPAFCLLLFYVCLEHYFLSRADYSHGVLFMPVMALTVPLLFASPPGIRKGGDPEDFMPVRKGPVFVVLVTLTVAILDSESLRPNLALARSALALAAKGGLDPRMPDRQRLLLNDPTLSDEIRATEYVRQRTLPSAQVFVGVKDHSSAFTNDVRAYWLSERLPGLKYVHLDSAVAGQEKVQREITSELQRHGVDWAILLNLSGTVNPHLFPDAPSGSRVLDEYLQEHFLEEARFGRYSVFRRKRP
jgi:hypothetical protein